MATIANATYAQGAQQGNDPCMICYDRLTSQVDTVKHACGKVFCKSCIHAWAIVRKNPYCPNCFRFLTIQTEASRVLEERLIMQAMIPAQTFIKELNHIVPWSRSSWSITDFFRGMILGGRMSVMGISFQNALDIHVVFLMRGMEEAGVRAVVAIRALKLLLRYCLLPEGQDEIHELLGIRLGGSGSYHSERLYDQCERIANHIFYLQSLAIAECPNEVFGGKRLRQTIALEQVNDALSTPSIALNDLPTYRCFKDAARKFRNYLHQKPVDRRLPWNAFLESLVSSDIRDPAQNFWPRANLEEIAIRFRTPFEASVSARVWTCDLIVAVIWRISSKDEIATFLIGFALFLLSSTKEAHNQIKQAGNRVFRINDQHTFPDDAVKQGLTFVNGAIQWICPGPHRRHVRLTEVNNNIAQETPRGNIKHQATLRKIQEHINARINFCSVCHSEPLSQGWEEYMRPY